MSDRQNAVIDGSLAEIKFVKSRSVAVLCVEIPIERAEEAIGKFGIPLPGQEIPVAVARLMKPPPEPHHPPQGSSAARERYRSVDAMQQAVMRAGMLCQDKRFQEWAAKPGPLPPSEGNAAQYIYLLCGISSRKEIGTSEEAYRRFLDLEQQFRIATGQAAEPRG